MKLQRAPRKWDSVAFRTQVHFPIWSIDHVIVSLINTELNGALTLISVNVDVMKIAIAKDILIGITKGVANSTQHPQDVLTSQ